MRTASVLSYYLNNVWQTVATFERPAQFNCKRGVNHVLSGSSTGTVNTKPHTASSMGGGASTGSKVVKLSAEYQALADDSRRKSSAGSDGSAVPRCKNDNFVFDSSGNVKNMRPCELDNEVPEITKIKDLERLFENCDEHARTLELVLASTEGTNLELSEKVAQLEEQLEIARSNAVRFGSYDEMIHIKNQQIHWLELEVKAAKEELAMQQLRSKRKIKKLQMDMVHAKQEANLTIVELREKMKNLLVTTKPPKEECSPKRPNGDAECCSQEDKRHILILELSNQVSAQQEKINELETMLQSREEKIQKLEAECQSKHGGNSIEESMHRINAGISLAIQHRMEADLAQEPDYIKDVALTQKSVHEVASESPMEYRDMMDPDITAIYEPRVDVNDLKKYDMSMEDDFTQDYELIVDEGSIHESRSILSTDFAKGPISNVDSGFNLKCERSLDTNISQNLEYFAETDLNEECLVKESHEDIDETNERDSNGESESVQNEIVNECPSDVQENPTSPTQNILSNSEEYSRMQTSPLSTQMNSPTSPELNDSNEEPKHAVNESFTASSIDIGNEEHVEQEGEEGGLF